MSIDILSLRKILLVFKTKETKSLGSSFRLAPKAETNSSTANGSTVALRGWPRRLEAPFSGQGSSAGLYGLGNGFGFGIRNLRFSMGSPQTPRGGGVELFGEHRSPFRDPHARRASFQAKH